MNVRRPAALPVLLLAATVLLSGCGGGDPDESAASRTTAAAGAPESSATPSDPGGTDDDGATDAPPFPANAEPDTEEASTDARVTVRDIRIGRHDGFDRVVFEVDGTGTPGWDVRYVDAASSQGSGNPVEVAGDAVLQVTVTGAGYPYDTGIEEYAGPDPLAVADTETVTEVHFDNTFEGTTVAFVGTAARTPFRVYLLQDPVRIVLEVADAG
jgi:hypothetical protein